MKIVAIIVTFNRLEKLKLTISKSLESDVEQIVIVNNNSQDGTKEYLNSLTHERLIVKHLETNIGGAGGFNVGFDCAVNELGADWIICYDDDAYPQDNTIEKFRKLVLDEDVASLAASVFLANGSVSIMNKVRINPLKNIKNFVNTFIKRESIYIDESLYNSQDMIEIDSSTFVGFFMRADVIKKVGLPRKELFIYADDLIYTLGITMHGYRHLFVPALKFTHDCGTLIDNQDVYNPIWKVYYTYRNRIEMYRVSSKWLYLPIVLLQITPWIRKKRFYEDSKLYIQLLRVAIVDGLKGDFSKTHTDILEIVNRATK